MYWIWLLYANKREAIEHSNEDVFLFVVGRRDFSMYMMITIIWIFEAKLSTMLSNNENKLLLHPFYDICPWSLHTYHGSDKFTIKGPSSENQDRSKIIPHDRYHFSVWPLGIILKILNELSTTKSDSGQKDCRYEAYCR